MVDGWEFRDDRGHEVRAAERPQKVLAYAQAARTLAGLGVPVVGYFGSQHNAESGDAPAGLDAPSVGAGADVDLQAVKDLQPDLVLSVTYGGEVYGVTPEIADGLQGIAPVLTIGIAGDRTLESVIARFHELVEALGAEISDPRSALDDALDKLAEERNPARRVMALSGGTPTDAYVANPAYWPSLRALAEAGVTFTPTTATGGWEVVKWTDLPTAHPADVILYDQRPNSLGPEALAAIPSWSQVPAVHTGNVFPWHPEPTLTYAAAAAFVRSLTP